MEWQVGEGPDESFIQWQTEFVIEVEWNNENERNHKSNCRDWTLIGKHVIFEKFTGFVSIVFVHGPNCSAPRIVSNETLA